MGEDWTLNQSKVLERGWSTSDIGKYLGPGKQIPWRQRTLTVWPLSEIEAAEAEHPELGDKIKGHVSAAQVRSEVAKQKAAIELRREMDRKEAERKLAVNRTWINVEAKAADFERKFMTFKMLADWVKQRYSLEGYVPPKSMWFDEVPDFFNTSYPKKMDPEKLFLVRESYSSANKKSVFWLAENGAKAVAVLRSLNIPADYDSAGLLVTGVDAWNGRLVFRMELERHHAGILDKHGDCSWYTNNFD